MASVLSLFDPLVGDWFRARFDKATEPQVLGWPAIREGHVTLPAAPLYARSKRVSSPAAATAMARSLDPSPPFPLPRQQLPISQACSSLNPGPYWNRWNLSPMSATTHPTPNHRSLRL